MLHKYHYETLSQTDMSQAGAEYAPKTMLNMTICSYLPKQRGHMTSTATEAAHLYTGKPETLFSTVEIQLLPA